MTKKITNLFFIICGQTGIYTTGVFMSRYNYHQYHPTSGLMQILHFDWLRYQGTISNSHRVAKLAPSSVTLSFVLFPNKYFFNLHLLTLLLPFLSDQLVNSPFGFASWAIDPQPARATGLIVNYHYQLESYTCKSFYTRANQNNLTCDLELIGLNYLQCAR